MLTPHEITTLAEPHGQRRYPEGWVAKLQAAVDDRRASISAPSALGPPGMYFTIPSPATAGSF